jgi:DNA invertase Pin-like site-specific DNA recombinase
MGLFGKRKILKTFIRAYLKASKEDQFADRVKEMLKQFVQERGIKSPVTTGRTSAVQNLADRNWGAY